MATVSDADREKARLIALELSGRSGRIIDALIEAGWRPPVSATPEREALREQIAEAIWCSDLDYTPEQDAWVMRSQAERDDYRRNADAVLAVLPSRETVEDAADVIATVKAYSMLAAGLTLTPNDVDALVLWINKHEARESVAPTREQVLDLLNSPQHAPMATHDGRTGECLACPVPLYELGPDAVVDAVLALLPGESREAVEAKARAEVIEWYEDQGLHHLKHDADAREHFGIEADRD